MNDGSVEHPASGTNSPSSATVDKHRDRLRYPIADLLRLRYQTKPSRAFIEHLRSNLGSVAKDGAERLWASRLAANGTSSSFQPKNRIPRAGSPPPNRTQDDVSHPRRNPDAVESAARLSVEHDISRIFPTSTGNVAAVPPRASPKKRSDFASRLLVKTDGNGSMAPLSLYDNQEPLARSPGNGTLLGAADLRKMSPRASPKTSPRPSGSPSVPPGFGPPQNVRNGGSHARNLSNFYKSRICQGPNVKENFATRIAYQQRKVSIVPTVAAPDITPDDTNVVAQQPVPETVVADGNLESCSQVYPAVDIGRDAGVGIHVPPPPTVNYNITSDEFDDLTKRLAAAAHNAAKSNVGNGLLDSFNVGNGDESIADVMSRDAKDTGPAESKESSQAKPNQSDVDALSKWLGRIAEASHDGQTEDLYLPEEDVVEPQAELAVANGHDCKEGLDSNMLNFFDTIRTQALSEGASLSAENGHAEKEMGGSEARTPSNMDAQQGVVPSGESIDQMHTTEVERFFQLFTEGKTDYSTAPKESRQTSYETTIQLGPAHNSSQGVSESQQESDTGSLERWFAKLASASGNQAQ